MKTWTERRMFTEEQIVTIQPNEIKDGIIIKLNEISDLTNETRLYLTYQEAVELLKQIKGFIDDNREATE